MSVFITRINPIEHGKCIHRQVVSRVHPIEHGLERVCLAASFMTWPHGQGAGLACVWSKLCIFEISESI